MRLPDNMVRRWRLVVAAVCLLTALMLVPTVGSVMHETDQAALLNGAWQLAEGRSVGTDSHHYGQQYAAYWFLAVLFMVFPTVDPVGLANAVSFALWWSGMLLLCWNARIRVPAAGAILLSAVLAPSSLVHSPYLATVFLSGGLLCLAEMLLLRHRSMWRRMSAMFLVFLAVGVRADALLVLPLLIWLSSSAASVSGLFRSSVAWGVSMTGLTSFALGALLSGSLTPALYTPDGDVRVFATLLVFGLGGAFIAVLSVVTAIGYAFSTDSQRRNRFLSAGLAAFLLPMIFYCFQMFSTRHWTQTVVGILLFCTSRRGQAVLVVGWQRRPVRLFVYATLVTAVLPLVTGVHLPFPDAPRPTVTYATKFPTADGLVPMGNYAQLVCARANGSWDGFDHNQGIWLAARQITKRECADSSGQVPVLNTPMANYLALAARMAGCAPVRCHPAETMPCGHRFHYADLRSLVRRDPAFAGAPKSDRRDFLMDRRVEVVGSRYMGHAIVRVWNEPGSGLPVEHALSELFTGCEFNVAERVLNGTNDAFVLGRDHVGKTAVFFADRPFTVKSGNETEGKVYVSQVFHGLHAVVVAGELRLKEGTVLRIGGVVSGTVHLAHSVLPDYMSVHQFMGHTSAP